MFSIDDIPHDFRNALYQQLNLFSLTYQLRTAIGVTAPGKPSERVPIVVHCRRRSKQLSTAALVSAAHSLLLEQQSQTAASNPTSKDLPPLRPSSLPPTRLGQLTLHHAISMQLALCADARSLQQVLNSALGSPLTAATLTDLGPEIANVFLRLHRAALPPTHS
ncbi:hypothetical protein AOQ84DRAFT_224274, partial [Glonium stellatum]